MLQLILYSSYKCGQLDEFFRINIDMDLNVNSKPILFDLINNKLKSFGTKFMCLNSYGKLVPYVFTMDEFSVLLEEAKSTLGYIIGSYNNTFIHSYHINCKIRKSCNLSLQEIYFEKMLSI
jgi:hypothetical protein